MSETEDDQNLPTVWPLAGFPSVNQRWSFSSTERLPAGPPPETFAFQLGGNILEFAQTTGSRTFLLAAPLQRPTRPLQECVGESCEWHPTTRPNTRHGHTGTRTATQPSHAHGRVATCFAELNSCSDLGAFLEQSSHSGPNTLVVPMSVLW